MAHIEFLGRLSDICGPAQDITLPKTVTTIATLRIWLNTQYVGEPLSCPSVRAIVNGGVVTDTHPISNSDIVAFFPPVGGG